MVAQPEANGPATILIAEDHPESRDALVSLLRAVGYRVLPAVDGREAVDLALRSKPDLILMDLMMPEVDGLAATRSLRGNSEFPAIPIVALTALDDARDKAISAGCDDYVSKPIKVPLLLARIRYWLEA